jgi:hypothetical protein
MTSVTGVAIKTVTVFIIMFFGQIILITVLMTGYTTKSPYVSWGGMTFGASIPCSTVFSRVNWKKTIVVVGELPTWIYAVTIITLCAKTLSSMILTYGIVIVIQMARNAFC